MIVGTGRVLASANVATFTTIVDVSGPFGVVAVAIAILGTSQLIGRIISSSEVD